MHTEVKSFGQTTPVVRILAGIPTQRARMPEYVFLNIYLGNMRVSRGGLILERLPTNLLTHYKSPASPYFPFFVSRFKRL